MPNWALIIFGAFTGAMLAFVTDAITTRIIPDRLIAHLVAWVVCVIIIFAIFG